MIDEDNTPFTRAFNQDVTFSVHTVQTTETLDQTELRQRASGTDVFRVSNIGDNANRVVFTALPILEGTGDIATEAYVDANTGGNSPFEGYTITGTPTTENAVPKWTADNTLQWSTDDGGQGTVSVTGPTPTAGDRVEWAGANTLRTPTGIQRIVTDLPVQTENISDDTTKVYHILIDTLTAIPRDISVRLFGVSVDNLDNVLLDNLHLAAQDNVFTFTLTANQVRAWNANANSDTPNFNGFEIYDGSTRIESPHAINQVFGGSANDNSAGVQQNHQDIVALQTADTVLTNRIASLENEVHQLESSGRRVNTTFFREVSSIDTTTIDEVTLYYRLADTGLTTPLQFGASISGLVGENAIFTAQANSIGGDMIGRLDRHLNNVLRDYGNYVRTRPGGQAPETIARTGQVITRYATLALSDGTDTITLPLEVEYDGQGTAHHILYAPYPASATLNYTSYTVRYFINNFIVGDTDNDDSSVNLVAQGFLSQISVPFDNADRALLNTDFNTNSANGQFHFVQAGGGTPVSYPVASFSLSTNVPAYAGYQRANMNLTGFTSGTATDPQAFAFGTMVVNGIEGSGPADSLTFTGGDGGSITWDAANSRVVITIGGTVVASIGTDGLRGIDSINDPTPES